MKKIHMAGLIVLAASSFTGPVCTSTFPTPAARYSNSLGTLSGALILQKALQLTFTQRPLLKTIAMGFRELDGRVDNALLGQSVKSRILSTLTVNAFGTGAQNVTDTDVPISLTDHKEIHVAFTPAEYNSTDRDLLTETAQPIAVTLANSIIDTIAALWLNAAYANKVTVASGWDYDNTLRALKKKLDDAGVPVEKRFFIPNSAVYDSLLGDSMIVTALNNPANAEAIRTGVLPEVMGLGITQYNQLPDNGENLVGVAGVPDATIFVARAPKNPEDMAGGLKFPGVLNYVEDPVTGFRVMVNQWINPDTLAINNRISWLQGFAKGNPNNLVRLVTS